ncbi:MAG TPA: AMP-binding protein [Enhygromyxa sp.]|nr:AMP-binding protein [Enhygromyxa sp.]
MNLGEHHRSMGALLRARVEAFGDETAYAVWDGERFVARSWASLWARASAVARGLAASGVEPGQGVLFLLTEIEAAILGQWGAWLAGAAPTQVGLPYRLSDPAAFITELQSTAARLHANVLVTEASFATLAGKENRIGVTTIAALERAGHESGLPLPGELPGVEEARAPALVQLTSGSTGRPRGVVIPHDRLLLHLRSISEALPATRTDSGVTWLPLHHDMGMIGGLLYPLFNAFVMHLCSPLHFRGDPYLWLRALSEVDATHTVGPPSAYAIVQRLAGRAARDGLDLSRLRCAMIGAEPVPAALLRQFADALAPCGFRAKAFFPVYGLAEATVAVSFPKPLSPTRVLRLDRRALERERVARATSDEDREALELVGVGAALPRSEVKVVDDRGEPLPDRHVGEILVRSETGMAGYFEDPQATAAAFVDGWLLTGDLGFLDAGQLFVTGRKKELIIKGGRSILPTVVEDAAARVDGVRHGCVAAFGVYDQARSTERMIVVAESKLAAAEQPKLARELRTYLQSVGFEVDEVAIVAPATLPKTTSGKLQRRALAAQFAS